MNPLGEFNQLIPREILGLSGSVYYSGRAAFGAPKPIYLLGLNPGGSPVRQAADTIERQIDACSQPDREFWSAYSDDPWLGKVPGTVGMQPRVLHLCEQLGLNPRTTPSSNLIFVRSAREADLGKSRQRLIDICWPFHAEVIQRLNVKMIICFGKTVGREVCNRLGADLELDAFTETNKRKWRSTVHTSQVGIHVATLTHPSIAAWAVPSTDPTMMVARCLKQLTETAAR